MANSLSLAEQVTWMRGHGGSDIGSVRAENEDRFLLKAWPDQSAILAVVADGMGGNQGGGEAAQIAIDTLADLLNQPLPAEWHERYEMLLKALHAADEAIQHTGGQSFHLLGMGATIVAAIITPDQYLYLHAGDCRLYHFRGGELLRQSKDHSVVQLLVDLGKITPDEVADHPMRSVVNSCLGGKRSTHQFSVDPKWDDANPPIYASHPDDIVLLCSDGLHGAIPQAQLNTIVSSYQKRPEGLVQTLIDTALKQGSEDNITALVVQMGSLKAGADKHLETDSSEPIALEEPETGCIPVMQ